MYIIPVEFLNFACYLHSILNFFVGYTGHMDIISHFAFFGLFLTDTKVSCVFVTEKKDHRSCIFLPKKKHCDNSIGLGHCIQQNGPLQLFKPEKIVERMEICHDEEIKTA